MKNLFKSMMLVAVAAMGFTACVNENMDDVAPEMGQNMVTMTITADNADATRTSITEENGNAVHFGWNNEGEVLRVIEVAGENSSTAATTDYALKEGKASFTVSFAENTEAEAFTYYAVYPEANYVSNENKNLDKFKVALPEAQTYVADSFDASADLMIAKPYATTEQPTALSMQFTRLAAIAKMTLKGMPEDKNITALTFTAAGKALAGRAYVSLNTGVVEEYGYTGQSKDAIALTIDEAAAINNDAVYFTCFPFELVAGDTFEVKAVTADKYTYTKTVTLTESQSLAFTAGNMSAFTVNMSTADVVAPGKVFTLLTDVSQLHIGDEIIIANTTNNVALGSNAGNYRNKVDVVIENNTITAVEGVTVLTVGKEGANYTLYDSENSGYLAASSSSSNYMATKATLDANGQWKITISEGVTSIVAQGTYTRNNMKYNSGSPRFSCYASGQNPVSIFLNDINNSDPVIPTITAETAVALTSEESEGTVTITTQNVEGEVTATLGADYDWFVAELDEDGNLYYIASANDTDASRTATVTLSAEGATDVVITFTQSAPAAVVAKSTVADFIATADTETYYELTGVVSNVVNTTYGNFDLTDATDTIYVYGLYSTDGQTSQYWSTSGVKAGDVITVQGQYKYYSSKHEVVNARYISHYGFTATATSTSIEAAGGNTTITLAITGTLPEAITFTKEGDATVSLNGNTATVTYDENGEEARSTTITFKSGLATQTVTINQAATSTGGGEGGESTESLTFSSLNLSNSADLGTYSIGDVSVAFGKGTNNSNSPKYYTSDATARYYVNNTITFTSEKTITRIVITHKNNAYAKITEYTAADGVVTWTGSSQSVQFTGSGTGRIVSVEVTYAN